MISLVRISELLWHKYELGYLIKSLGNGFEQRSCAASRHKCTFSRLLNYNLASIENDLFEFNIHYTGPVKSNLVYHNTFSVQF